ncbi:MAG: UDP-2,3-diacylglucosamine diphosphatase [Porticoccaceae bacterium]
MADLFISDLHLSPERPDISRAFFHFLQTRAREAERLYILGDLTEAWVGDDDPDPHTRQIVAALRTLGESGTGVFFQHGNRDFLVGQGFARESGATLLTDYHVLNSGDQRVLLCHGDTLCSDDKSYQRFRRVVRSRLFLWWLRNRSLAKRQDIARRLRARSRMANSNKAGNIMDVNEASVARVMKRFRADLLIHGHTHRPAIHDHGAGRRVVLGDWGDYGWYATLDNGNVELHRFDIDP